ncbi:MAG: hypothetical protein QOG26_54 [Solirubrobacterales bacterium]|nr:hypothetical protein [Solirubrobacterales bacterium]MDX6652298.1 hypothetical protein [Solirubrobacterales bacterium]
MTRMRPSPIRARRDRLALSAAVVATLALSWASTALATDSGGVGASSGTTAGSGTATAGCTPGKKAVIDKEGRASIPCQAPARIAKAIKAANQIRNKPYVWGGGHGSWRDHGYDCSGAVSYALHAAGLLKPDRPMDSGQLAHQGGKGKGAWVTLYANSGHVYAYIAGLRWDTSAPAGPTGAKTGPSWTARSRSNSGFQVRHYSGF